MTQLPLAVKRVLSYLPTNLPVGLSQFNTFADSIIELAGPYADQDSMRFAVASMIIHLPAGTAAVPKNYFVKSLRKSAANQVASQVFQDIKTKQAAQLEAAKKQAEDTAKLETTTQSGQKETQN